MSLLAISGRDRAAIRIIASHKNDVGSRRTYTRALSSHVLKQLT